MHQNCDLTEDLGEGDDADADGDLDDEEEEPPAPTKGRTGSDEDEDDDEEADPDDVEEDLDTILRDRIAAGADEDDEDEEAGVETPDTGDRVAPRAAEEHACPECFLLVRRSQFSARRTDCPGGLDGDDCPMKAQFS